MPRATPITIALASRAPTGLNPQQAGLTGGDNWAIRQIFDTLVKADDGTFAVRPEDFRPCLAESWESSEDAKTWIYRLRQGVKFHKGYGEITSDDVRLHLRASSRSEDRDQHESALLEHRVGQCSRTSIRSVSTSSGPDPIFNGSVVTTLAANHPQPESVRGDAAPISPWTRSAPAPTRSTSVSQTEGVLLTAFPDYFEGPAVTKTVQISFIADTTARTLALPPGKST